MIHWKESDWKVSRASFVKMPLASKFSSSKAVQTGMDESKGRGAAAPGLLYSGAQFDFSFLQTLIKCIFSHLFNLFYFMPPLFATSLAWISVQVVQSTNNRIHPTKCRPLKSQYGSWIAWATWLCGKSIQSHFYPWIWNNLVKNLDLCSLPIPIH